MPRVLPCLLVLALSMCHVEHGASQATDQSQPTQAEPAASTNPALAEAITAILNDPAVARAHWGILVESLDGTAATTLPPPAAQTSNHILYALNEGQSFQPASNAKLFTTAAALALLGKQRRFTTTIESPAHVTGNGELHGDLILRGTGDANLSGRTIPYVEPLTEATHPPAPLVQPDPLRYLEAMADNIVSAGVRHIQGDIVGDDTLFPYEPYAPDWAIDDMVWGYGAPVSALSVNDNQLRLTVAPGPRVGDAAVVTLEPLVKLASGLGEDTLSSTAITTAAVTSTELRIDRAVGSHVIEVSGTIPIHAKPHTEEIAISDPAEFAAAAFKQLLEARGVTITGVARARHRPSLATLGSLAEGRQPLTTLPQGAVELLHLAAADSSQCAAGCTLLAQHLSPTLADDVVVTNKVSQNLHAELLLHALSTEYGEDLPGGAGRGSIAEGTRVVRQFLINAGLDGNDFVFYDGSGLSGHDLVTPRSIVQLLRFATTQPWFDVYRNSLPVGGVDGGLTVRFTDPSLKGHVFAKTGTLGEVRALSGYLECHSGRTVVFSILVGNRTPSSTADRIAMDKIVAAIAQIE